MALTETSLRPEPFPVVLGSPEPSLAKLLPGNSWLWFLLSSFQKCVEFPHLPLGFYLSNWTKWPDQMGDLLHSFTIV